MDRGRRQDLARFGGGGVHDQHARGSAARARWERRRSDGVPRRAGRQSAGTRALRILAPRREKKRTRGFGVDAVDVVDDSFEGVAFDGRGRPRARDHLPPRRDVPTEAGRGVARRRDGRRRRRLAVGSLPFPSRRLRGEEKEEPPGSARRSRFFTKKRRVSRVLARAGHGERRRRR